jgi:hypothetical protein
MNPTRTPSYQVSECIRLASYLGPEGRLYSDTEIAEKLGESPQWVKAIVSPHLGWDSSRKLATINTTAVNMTYDPERSS